MAGKAHRSGQVCPKGHYMDPNWDVCPYCEAEERSKKKSSKPDKAEKSDRAEPVSAGGGRKTTVGQVPPAAQGERKTSAMPAMGAYGGGAGPAEVDTRRILGVMVSYTWRPEGEVYPVREGKNYIGADRIADDPAHRYCDVRVPDDTKMSGQHALILCRQGGMELIDKESTNGTYLNGEKLLANMSHELTGQAEIKAGSTVFTFMAVPQIPQETPAPPAKKESAPLDDRPHTRPR